MERSAKKIARFEVAKRVVRGREERWCSSGVLKRKTLPLLA
jgi:hypothetical protein